MNLSYSDRAKLFVNPIAKRFLNLMDTKQTNLCLSADLTNSKDLIEIIDKVGPFICLLKTHIDTLIDFDYSVIEKILILAQKHNFLIFEDRKFADIGNTVIHQYRDIIKGVYHIASWAHFTNAHPIPGDGIVEGLKSVGLNPPSLEESFPQLKNKPDSSEKSPRALLLLAEMSSKGSLATGDYSSKTVEMATRHKDFVVGFISSCRIHEKTNPQLTIQNGHDFINMTPGIQLETGVDSMGQQYRTPDKVIREWGSDVIIVGRGIYENVDVVQECIKYRDAGWNAYLNRLKQ